MNTSSSVTGVISRCSSVTPVWDTRSNRSWSAAGEPFSLRKHELPSTTGAAPAVQVQRFQLLSGQRTGRNQSYREGGLDSADELTRLALGHQSALLDDGHPVAHLLRLLHIMRGNNDRGPAIAHLPHQGPQVAARHRVQPGCGFIKNHQLRVVHQAGRKSEALLFPTRQLANTAGRLVLQAHPTEQFGRRQASGIEAPKKGEYLAEGQVLVVGGSLQLHTRPGLDVPPLGGHIQTQYADLAHISSLQTLYDLQRRCLPGAIRTQKTKDLTPLHRKGKVIDSDDVAVPFDQIFHQQGLGHSSKESYHSRTCARPRSFNGHQPSSQGYSGSVPIHEEARVSTSEQKLSGVSSEAVAAATGRTWDEWAEFLDGLGAQEMTHKDIVALVAGPGGLSNGWWQQSVTVGYEQARGLRVVGQTSTADFQIGVQKTIPVHIDLAWALLTEQPGRHIWLGKTSPLQFRKGEKYETAEGHSGKSAPALPDSGCA